jgi:hypothetical protein
MIVLTYLKNVLKSQTLDPSGQEMKDLQTQRKQIEVLLRETFGGGLTIKYGGSKAKGTMIRDAYDLDIIAYVDCDDDSVGKTLKEIFDNVEKAVAGNYTIRRKRSALRLRSKDGKVDFQIDLVPGRYTDDEKKDAFLYQSQGDKGRLKTNLDKHIDHVKDCGVVDAIRLLKLWRARNDLSIKNFVLELLVIDILASMKKKSLDEQLTHVFTQLRDNVSNLQVKDPANPEGNDLSDLLDEKVRNELKSKAKDSLKLIEDDDWEGLYGEVPEAKEEEEKQKVERAAQLLQAPPKPWLE